MTEKRFQVTQTTFGSGIYDFQAEDTLCESYDEDAYSQVVKKLNELYEENKQLRFDFKEMKGLLHSFEDEIEKLEKENKELKAKYNRCIEDWEFANRTEMAHHRVEENALQDKINSLCEERRQLKIIADSLMEYYIKINCTDDIVMYARNLMDGYKLK